MTVMMMTKKNEDEYDGAAYADGMDGDDADKHADDDQYGDDTYY